MKRIYKTRISRLIALTLTFCMVFQMMPMSIFADDITSTGAIDLEIEQLEQEIEDLESQVEELLGTSMSDILTSDDVTSESAITDDEPAITEDESPVPMLLTAAASDSDTVTQDYVVDGTTMGTFTFDVATQTITGYDLIVTNQSHDLVIPSTITADGEEVSVLSIGNGSTSVIKTSVKTINSVTISEGITALNPYAFNGTQVISKITLPETMTTLGNYSLNSVDLTSVNFPAALTTIGNNLLNGTNLTIADLSETKLTEITYGMFSGMTTLTEVKLPDTITTIGYAAFKNCTALTSVNLPSGITRIGYQAFSDCTKLNLDAADLNAMTGLITVDFNAFYNVKNLTGDLVLPESLTTLGDYAFSGTGLTGADFSKTSLTNLSSYVMSGCSSLVNLTLPAGLKTIGYNAFDNTKITTLVLPETVTQIYDNAFENTLITSLHIPQNVTLISHYAFYNVPLNVLTFADGERSLTIAKNVFQGAALTSLTLPDIGSNTLSLGYNAFTGTTLTTLTFQNCTLTTTTPFQNQPLKNITMPPGMTVIPYGIFQNVPLESTDFLMGFDITAIEDYAFSGCSAITGIPDFPNLKTIGNYAFSDCSALTGFSDSPKLKTIGSYAFKNCTSLTASPNTAIVTTIGDYAFYNCDSLTELDLYATGSSTTLLLGASIIGNCDHLTTLNFHGDGIVKCNCSVNSSSSVYSFGPFKENTSVTTINWPEEMKQVGDVLFANAAFVENIDFLPETVYSLGAHAFNSSGLTELTIPENITYLGKGVFAGCTSLESLTVENDIDTWNSANSERYFFYRVDFAKFGADPSITLPDTWTEIPGRMFYYSNLTTIDFLENNPHITKIGDYAFSDCKQLTSINIPANITSIGIRAFYGSLTLIEALTIPATVTELIDDNGTYQNFYDTSKKLQDVYILNPNLDLNTENLSSGDAARVFYYGYSAASPLTIHSVMDSTAFELCEASDGRYLFSAINASSVITVAIMDGETDLTDQCTIHWKDANGISLGTSAQITPLEAGITYTYEIQLPDDLLTGYYIPESGTVTSTATAQEITIDLTPIGTTSFTGTVVNAAGEPMAWADVTVTQIVNGIESELYTWTDTAGKFTIGTADDPALDVYTELLISYIGYYSGSRVQTEPSGLETVDLGTITLKSLPASTVVLKVNALLDHQPYVMSDLSSLSFSVTNDEGKTVESTLQDHTLILTTSAGITLDSNEPLFLTVAADPSAEAVAPEESIEFYLRDETVEVNLTSWGRISVTTAAMDPETDPGQYLWIYDSDGQLCYSDTLHYWDDDGTDRFIGETDLLQAGTYTVVIIDRTFPMEAVSHLDILTDFGLIPSQHYYRQTVTVTNGTTALLENVAAPSFEGAGGDDLFTDMFESITISTNHVKPIVGQTYYLTIEYTLKETYRDNGQTTFSVQLPRNTLLLSSYLPGGVGEASLNEDTFVATLNTAAGSGTIFFELRSLKADALASIGVTPKQNSVLGLPVSYKLPIRSISIEPYMEDATYYQTYTVDLRSTPGCRVYLYKDDAEVGSAVTNAIGTATMTFPLAEVKPMEGTSWTLTAKTELEDGTVLKTEAPVVVTYDPDPFDIQIRLPGNCYQVINGEKSNIFRWNDPYNNPSMYFPVPHEVWSTNEDTGLMEMNYIYLWEATVAENMGQYIKDGILWIDISNANNYPGYQVPLYRTDDTSDTFRGFTEMTGGTYLDVTYETTDEYKADKTPILSAELLDSQMKEAKDTIGYDEFETLWAETADAEKDFQELLETTTNATIREYLKAFEMERQDIWDTYYSIAGTRLGIHDTTTLKNEEDSTQLLETLGYTEKTLRSGDLDLYENDPDFVKMYVEDEDGTIWLSYVKHSSEEMVVVSEKDQTITTFKCSGVNAGGSTARMFRSSRSGEGGDQYAEAIDSVSTAFNAIETAIDAEMEFTKERMNKLHDTLESMDEFSDYEKRVIERANFKRLSFLRHLKTRYIPYIGGLLNIGSLWSDYSDRQVALQNHDETLQEWDDIVTGRDKRDLKDPKACLQALLDLAEAYQNLADAIGVKILSAVTQLVACLGSIAALIPTGGSSALFALCTFLAGFVLDQGLDYMVNRCKSAVTQAKIVRNKACDTASRRRRKLEANLDPSGYVYEAVPSNRVSDVTATVYYKDENNEPVKWLAENYGQSNPLSTTPDGRYRWDVPVGEWMVTYNKDGYTDQDSRDIYGWLPVLPIQTEVHVPLESTAAPTVASAYGYSDTIQLTFSQYMKEESLSGQITVTQGEEVLSGDDLLLHWLNSEDSDLFYDRSFASELQIQRKDGAEWKIGSATITVNGGKNYVDTALATWSQSVNIITAPAEIQGSASIGVEFGSTTDVTLTIVDSHGDPVSGVTVELALSGLISAETPTAVTDESGQVTFTISGDYLGEDRLTATVVGHETKLEIPVSISLDGSSTIPVVPDEPVVMINGTSYSGQGHTVTVEEGTVIQITGDSGDTLYYNIGENSCPCADDQILIEDGQLTITESGYYKFAAYANGQYSSRVHITITVTEAGGGGNEGGDSEPGPGNDDEGGGGSHSGSVTEPEDPIVEPPVEPPVIDNPFSDVKDTAYYYEAVLWALTNNVTSGTSETTFGPNLSCTRAQAVTFLWNAAGKPEPQATDCPFVDVSPTAYYYKAVLWAVEQGITSGTSKTTFDPNATCTRGQIVTFLWNAAEKPEITDDAMAFTDVSETAYYNIPVAWAVEQDITSGTSKTTFSPGNHCTRAQIVTFLWKYYAK